MNNKIICINDELNKGIQAYRDGAYQTARDHLEKAFYQDLFNPVVYDYLVYVWLFTHHRTTLGYWKGRQYARYEPPDGNLLSKLILQSRKEGVLLNPKTRKQLDFLEWIHIKLGLFCPVIEFNPDIPQDLRRIRQKYKDSPELLDKILNNGQSPTEFDKLMRNSQPKPPQEK